MALDPAIPLGIHLYSYLDDAAKQQQISDARQEHQIKQQSLADAMATKQAYGEIFSNGGHPTPQALNHLASVDPEAAFKVQQYFAGVDKQSREEEAAKWSAAAPILARIKQVPYEQRGAYLQSAAPVLVAHGWTPQELSSFDPTDQNVDALSSAAMTVDQVVNANKIGWHPIGENGSFATDQFGNPTGSGNPFAPASQVPAHSAPVSGNPAPNNNPGALRVPGSTQFQSFATPQQGIAAQGALLNRYMGRGLNTVSKIVETYAPRKSRGGDNTDEQVSNYINYVAGKLGVDPNAPLPPGSVARLGQAMREFETGHRSSTGGVPHLSSRAEYDALPAGSQYVAPDGSLRTKS